MKSKKVFHDTKLTKSICFAPTTPWWAKMPCPLFCYSQELLYTIATGSFGEQVNSCTIVTSHPRWVLTLKLLCWYAKGAQLVSWWSNLKFHLNAKKPLEVLQPMRTMLSITLVMNGLIPGVTSTLSIDCMMKEAKSEGGLSSERMMRNSDSGYKSWIQTLKQFSYINDCIKRVSRNMVHSTKTLPKHGWSKTRTQIRLVLKWLKEITFLTLIMINSWFYPSQQDSQVLKMMQSEWLK